MSRTITEQLSIIKTHNRLGIMTHVVVGYPSLADTKERILRMAEAGVDIIELQLPFSDPMADGPVIMQANQVAVAAGIGVMEALQLAESLTEQIDIPLQYIGYYNTILQYGVEQFVHDSSAAGIQGFTIPDLPFEEESHEGFYQAATQVGLPVIQLVSPATPVARLQDIAQRAEGFVYCVARFGVTGGSTSPPSPLLFRRGERGERYQYLQRVRKYVTLPLAVGFGISKPEHIQALRGQADIAVIGSALLTVPTAQLFTTLHKLCA